MLALLLVQAVTGLFANDEIANAGPFYGWVAPETSNRLSGLHGTNSNLLLGPPRTAPRGNCVVRVRGRPAAGAGDAHGQEGRERRRGRREIQGSRIGLALAILAVLSVALALAMRAAPEATIALY